MGKSRFIELMAKVLAKLPQKKSWKSSKYFLDQFPEYRKMQKVTDALKSDLKQPDPTAKQKDLRERIEELWYKIKNSGEALFPSGKKVMVRSLVNWQWAAAAVLIFTISGVFFIPVDHDLLTS